MTNAYPTCPICGRLLTIQGKLDVAGGLISGIDVRYAALIQTIRTAQPDAIILATSVPPLMGTLNTGSIAANALVVPMLQSLDAADDHVVFVDISAVNNTTDMWNQWHPGPSGYVKITDAWTTPLLAAVPEPATMLLLAGSGAALLRRRPTFRRT